MGSYGVLGQKKMIFEIFDFFRRFDEILDAKNSDFSSICMSNFSSMRCTTLIRAILGLEKKTPKVSQKTPKAPAEIGRNSKRIAAIETNTELSDFIVACGKYGY